MARGPARIPSTMTMNLLDEQRAPELLETPAAKLGRAPMMIGALIAVLGAGYAAGRLTAPAGPPPPTAPQTPPALAEVPAPLDDEEEIVTGEPLALGEEEEEGEGAPEAPASASQGAAPADDGSFYVRVASYKAEEDAAKYAALLSARGLAATASPDPSGADWQVVRLGPYQSRGAAEAARFELKLQEREKAYVVPRSNGKYHVQVGSFATREQAEPVAESLRAEGHATKITRVKMGDRRWHCVRIGPFDTADEAAEYRKLVKGISEEDTAVIPYPPPDGRAP